MITLLQNGAWLLNGQEIVEDTADSTAILNSKLGYIPEKKMQQRRQWLTIFCRHIILLIQKSI